MAVLLQSLVNGAAFMEPPSKLMQQAKTSEDVHQVQSATPVQPVGSFLGAALSCHTATERPEGAYVADESLLLGTEPTSDGGAQKGVEEADMPHGVPGDVLAKWGHVLDIVTPDSCLTNCFTKTYTRFAKVCSVQSAASILGATCHPGFRLSLHDWHQSICVHSVAAF